jgi:hypothetical protein
MLDLNSETLDLVSKNWVFVICRNSFHGSWDFSHGTTKVGVGILQQNGSLMTKIISIGSIVMACTGNFRLRVHSC